MKILPNPMDHFLRPGEETADGRDKTQRPRQREGPAGLPADRVEISAQGRKEQIQQEMVAEIIRKIR